MMTLLLQRTESILPDFYSLPVYAHKDEILDALSRHQVIIVESPTGSGKTTQIPLILREAGYDETGIIGITQPRRIAALSVSEFIKKQIHDEDGSYCAYTMRFSDTSTHETRIKIMTDGILLQEVKADPLLSSYSVLMVDEAHERSLNIDFILGLLKEITAKRNDLKIIISSATINAASFSDYFDKAPVISISGKPYPVSVRYESMVLTRETEDEYWRGICRIVENSVKDENGGDILVFLPGEAEIKSCLTALHLSPISDKLQIYPLFGRLSKEEQERVFIPTEEGKRKVVISTNIAETSITIDGIRTVIDSGMAKVNIYNQRNFTSALLPIPISRASADQRKGRAGRTASGTCIRLYSEESYEKRPEFSEEEILHSDLAEVVLRMSELGIYNTEDFPFITPPKKSALRSAEETLITIGAIEESHQLTAIGSLMIKFPLVPRLSRVIVEAMMNYPEVIGNVLTAVSFLSTKSPYVLPPGEELAARDAHDAMQDPVYGDFVAMLTLYSRYSRLSRKDREEFAKAHYIDMQTMEEILHIKAQLEEIVRSEGMPVSDGGSVKAYFLALASGLRQYVCVKADRWSYRSTAADQILIHPGSAYFRKLPQYIIAGEIVKTTKMYARTCSPLKPEWLMELDPGIIQALTRKPEKHKSIKDSAPEPVNDLHALDIYKGRADGRECYIVPVKDLDKIGAYGSTRIYISIGSYISEQPIKARDKDAAYLMLSKARRPVSKKPDVKADPYRKEYEEISIILDFLLSPVSTDRKHFRYLYMKEAKGRYSLQITPSLMGALKESAYSLSSLIECLPKKDRKIRERAMRILKAAEAALDIST